MYSSNKETPTIGGIVLSPDRIFCAHRKNESDQLPIPFSFKCAGMLAHCSLLVQHLTSSNILSHIACQQSTSELYIDRAILAAAQKKQG